MRATTELPEGELVGEYRIGRVLGNGAFGVTYMARKGEESFAVKEYYPLVATRKNLDVVVKDPKNEYEFNWGLERFAQEAELLKNFDHLNVVKIIEIVKANNTVYFSMPFIKGKTLTDWIAQHHQPPLEAIREIFVPLLEGLRHVHAKNIFHRDIKPANIFIQENGNPILLDFGSARYDMGRRSQQLTVVLTPHFAPPEQYHTMGPFTHAIDIYSVGACIYNCLTGAPPIEATARFRDGGPDIYEKIADNFALRGVYPFYFLEAVDKSLSYHYHQRFQEAEEFIDALMGQSRAPRLLPPDPGPDPEPPTTIFSDPKKRPPSLAVFQNIASLLAAVFFSLCAALGTLALIFILAGQWDLL
jgi:serine/threonine protein kinase